MSSRGPVTSARGQLLRARAVSEYLGISEHKARQLIASGALATVRTDAGRLIGVYERDCDTWIAEHRRPAIDVAAQSPAPAVDDRIADLLPPPEDRIF